MRRGDLGEDRAREGHVVAAMEPWPEHRGDLVGRDLAVRVDLAAMEPRPERRGDNSRENTGLTCI